MLRQTTSSKSKAGALLATMILVTAGSAVQAAPPSVSINTKYIHESYSFHHITQVDTMRLQITGTDPDGTTPSLSAANLPAGASFVDSGNGVGIMSWAPSGGQLGFYNPRFTAFDGTGTDTDTAQILVAAYPLSHGIYRLGYTNSTPVRVAQDHLSHRPILKVDLFGSPQFMGSDSIPIEYQLAAAADGRVEEIIDTNCTCCSGCSACNNHIRIRHSNGEWTKYSHPEQASVVVDTVGSQSCVSAGDYLGEEGDVGATTGSSSSFQRNQKTCGQANDCAANNWNPSAKCFVHLHFEVRTTGPASGLRIPLFCDVPGNVLRQGDLDTASDCSSNSCPTDLSVPTYTYDGNEIAVVQVDNSITTAAAGFHRVEGTASVTFRAGNRITLKPGFAAKKYAYFHAKIAPCNGGNDGCPPP